LHQWDLSLIEIEDGVIDIVATRRGEKMLLEDDVNSLLTQGNIVHVGELDEVSSTDEPSYLD
jgi:hypothetical protein